MTVFTRPMEGQTSLNDKMDQGYRSEDLPLAKELLAINRCCGRESVLFKNFVTGWSVTLHCQDVHQ